MAKKKKEKEGFDSYKWERNKLKDWEERGIYMGSSKTRHEHYGRLKFPIMRYRKVRVPKWVWNLKKENEGVLSSATDFYEIHRRFPNNEERILSRVHYTGWTSVKEMANDTGIDYKNISRYLKKMEKKGLITIEPEYHIKTMPSGKNKRYHWKNIKPTKKGKDLHKELFGWRW
jgi:predicted transcriptional regulator